MRENLHSLDRSSTAWAPSTSAPSKSMSVKPRISTVNPGFSPPIMDTNEEERAKGKTVEVGRAHFDTDKKRYTVLDAPGHKNYVPAMIMEHPKLTWVSSLFRLARENSRLVS